MSDVKLKNAFLETTLNITFQILLHTFVLGIMSLCLVFETVHIEKCHQDLSSWQTLTDVSRDSLPV
jgi:hypothetical protein